MEIKGENLGSLIEREPEFISSVNTGFTEFYEGNDTILGCLNNLFNICVNEQLARDLYLISIIKEKIGYRRFNTRQEVIRKNTTEDFRSNYALKLIYDYIISHYPISQKIDFDKFNTNNAHVYFRVEDGFVLPSTRYSFSNEIDERIKIYLDLGYQYYYELLDNVFNLYLKLRETVDERYLKDSVLSSFSNINEFKARTAYGKDGIVFKLVDRNMYEKFIELLSEDKKLVSSLRMTNPFIPTEEINGFTIGVISGMRGSYNGYVAAAVYSYINNCISKDVEPSLIEFLHYIENNMEEIEVQKTEKRYCKKYGEIIINQVDKEMNK